MKRFDRLLLHNKKNRFPLTMNALASSVLIAGLCSISCVLGMSVMQYGITLKVVSSVLAGVVCFFLSLFCTTIPHTKFVVTLCFFGISTYSYINFRLAVVLAMRLCSAENYTIWLGGWNCDFLDVNFSLIRLVITLIILLISCGLSALLVYYHQYFNKLNIICGHWIVVSISAAVNLLLCIIAIALAIYTGAHEGVINYYVYLSALGGFFLLMVGFIIYGANRNSMAMQWLENVSNGRVPGWDIVPNRDGGFVPNKLFLIYSYDDANGVLRHGETNMNGPYRKGVIMHPIALVKIPSQHTLDKMSD